MTYIDDRALEASISQSLGYDVSIRQLGNTETVVARLRGLDYPNGLSLHVTAGLQMVFADLVWDNFASPLMRIAGTLEAIEWQRLSDVRSALSESGIETTLTVDGAPKSMNFDPSGYQLSDWTIRAQSVIEESAYDSARRVLLASFGCVLLLVGAQGDERGEVEFQVEGEHTWTISSKYERSRANRAIAILLHGDDCAGCGFSFGRTYGDIAAGYIEVHHLTPVHLMGAPRPVDPRTELVPLCANCHRAVHRADPPLSLAQLSVLLRTSH